MSGDQASDISRDRAVDWSGSGPLEPGTRFPELAGATVVVDLIGSDTRASYTIVFVDGQPVPLALEVDQSTLLRVCLEGPADVVADFLNGRRCFGEVAGDVVMTSGETVALMVLCGIVEQLADR